jgi:phosphatidylinositol alpha 1,6-mannosyltransferase
MAARSEECRMPASPDPRTTAVDTYPPEPNATRTARLKVALVSESPLTFTNGVSNSVVRTLEHLRATGHDAMVVAPAPVPGEVVGFAATGLRSIPLPRYRTYRLGIATTRTLVAALSAYEPDIVHLAAPAVLGRLAMRAARRLALPTVAVFQTDAAGFAARNGLGAFRPLIWYELRRIHDAADLTLVPSTETHRQLADRGWNRLAMWPRGVDIARFNPANRDEGLRRVLAPNGETIVGYVGRLSREKRVHLLAHLADLPGIRLVVVGDGPAGASLRRRLPNATFTGLKLGDELSALVASLDVFVHTGANETFCQAVQEALAAGVPAVAPAAGGPVDLIQDGQNGLLWPPDDTAALPAAVRRLVASPELRDAMGRNARRSVLGRTWDAIGTQLLAHYAGVLVGARTPG